MTTTTKLRATSIRQMGKPSVITAQTSGNLGRNASRVTVRTLRPDR